MSELDRQSQRWKLVAIPWWPGKWRLAVTVPAALVTIRNSSLTQGTSLLKDWALTPDACRVDYGSYTFASAQSSIGSEQAVFVWNPPISSEQRETPIVSTEYDSISYPWPPILEDAEVVEDPTNGRVALRRAWREPFQGKSTVRIRKYVSSTPWTEAELEKDAPMDTPVQADYNALQINIPSCLHPKIEVENQVDDSLTVYDLVPSRSGGKKVGNVVIFPRTNHSTYEDHIYDVKVEEEDGLYLRTTFEVLAPELQPVSYVAS